MIDPEQWTQATVTERIVWDEGLFTSTLDLSLDFKPGQFATLAMQVDDKVVKRAYSIGSAPGKPLEFFIVAVEGGELSPRLWSLQVGDQVWVRNKTGGLFTIDRIPDGEVLWLVGTGTGIAPYVSMLREGSLFQHFEHVVLVQGARYARQLAYRAELRAYEGCRPFTYVPTVTREADDGVLSGRITDLLDGGSLEARVGHALHPKGHHVMLCGNPDMIKQMIGQLGKRGLELHKPNRHGQIHIEKYW